MLGRLLGRSLVSVSLPVPGVLRVGHRRLVVCRRASTTMAAGQEEAVAPECRAEAQEQPPAERLTSGLEVCWAGLGAKGGAPGLGGLLSQPTTAMHGMVHVTCGVGALLCSCSVASVRGTLPACHSAPSPLPPLPQEEPATKKRRKRKQKVPPGPPPPLPDPSTFPAYEQPEFFRFEIVHQ